MMKGGNSFSRREWILLVVILLLVQFIVHWLSLRYGSSVSALGYVSFAGTVVSILLGLIAIIYAFVQSFTQANSVVEIREQIDKLILAGDDIVRSKDDLHRSAVELGVITDELSNKIGESILATKEIAGSFGKLSDAFASQSPSASSSGSKKGDAASNKALTLVTNTRRIWLTVLMLAIAEGVKRGWSLDDVKEKIAIPVGAEFGHHAEFVKGMFNMALFSLEAEGFINIPAKDDEASKLTCNNGFLEKLEGTAPRSKSSEYKQLVAFWSLVDGLD